MQKKLKWISVVIGAMSILAIIRYLVPSMASVEHRAQRAWELSVSGMGTTTMAIIVVFLVASLLLVKAYYQHRWHGVRQHWDQWVKDGLYILIAVWLFSFFWYFIFNTKVYLNVSLAQQPGYSSASLKAGQEITQETMRDRKQYVLDIANKTNSVFEVIELRLQFPYPIDEKEIVALKDTGNVRFDRAGAIPRFEGGSATVMRLPLTSVYELHIDRMRPGGQVQLLFILNSWRDPRGKKIPPEEQARYHIPDVGPHITYMDGYFLADGIKEPFYAPFSLDEKGIVTLEKPQAAPKDLKRKLDLQ